MRELPDSWGPTEVLAGARREDSHILALRSGLGVWRLGFNSWFQSWVAWTSYLASLSLRFLIIENKGT